LRETDQNNQFTETPKLAKGLNRWENLRTQIIAELEKKKDFDFLMNLYLVDKEVGKAPAALKKPQPAWQDHYLSIEVAQGGKETVSTGSHWNTYKRGRTSACLSQSRQLFAGCVMFA